MKFLYEVANPWVDIWNIIFNSIVQLKKTGCFNYKFQITIYSDIFGIPIRFLAHFWWTAYPNTSHGLKTVAGSSWATKQLFFGSSFLCEHGFSALTEMKKRERLWMIDKELRVCLSKVKTRISILCYSSNRKLLFNYVQCYFSKS